MKQSPILYRKRFKTEAEILGAIEKAKRECQRLLEKGNIYTEQARALYRQVSLNDDLAAKSGRVIKERMEAENKTLVERAKWKQVKAGRFYLRADRMQGATLKRLGRKLAEFRTPMMLTGTGNDDQSIER